MRRTPFLLTASAVTAVTATMALTGGSAFAGNTGSQAGPNKPADVRLAKGATLQQIQAAAATDISNRVTALNSAIGKVKAATFLGSDQATLLTMLQSDVTGLQQLGQTIAADTTSSAAAANLKQVYTNFRVYVLTLPVAARVARDDRMATVAAPRLTKVAARIASKETPANQSQVGPLLSDLASHVSAATSAVNGDVATLEGYTPADWNANHSLLATSKASTATAFGDLTTARSDAKQAAADVGFAGRKGAKGTNPTSSTPAAAPTGAIA